MGGSSSQTIGQRYFAKLTTFIGNPIEKLIGINFDNRGWIFKPDNDETFLRVESPNLYGDKEGGVAGFIDIHTGTADQLPNATYEKDFSKVSGYPFQSYLVFRGLGKKTATSGGVGQFTQGPPKYYNDSFYHGNSGYMKEMLLWPQRIYVKNDDTAQWHKEKAGIGKTTYFGEGYIPATEISKIIMTDEFEFAPPIGTKTETSSSEIIFSNAAGWQFQMYQDGGLAAGAKTHALYLLKPSFVSYITIKFKVYSYAMAGDAVIQPYSLGAELLSFSVDQQNEENAIDNEISKIVTATFAVNENSQIGIINSVDNKSDEMSIGYNHAWILSIESSEMFMDMDVIDINPIHKIREILTDDTAMNKPEADVNDVNFMKAADRIWDEGLGISWAIAEKSCLEAINELCGHIEAGVRVNRQTGLFEMVLFRDDWFEEDEIHTLSVNKIKSMSLDVSNADEAINQLNVSYYNREAIKDSSFSVAENASIRNLSGRVNAEDADFPYFMNQRNAAVVAQWKLKQMSSPVWSGSFTTAAYEARKWNRYDLLKLAWPRKWQGEITVRILKINLGTGTDVSIDFVEVVPYSSDLSSSIVINTPVDTTPKPPQPALFKTFELSYLEAVQMNGQKAVDEALAYNPDAGYAAVIAKRPQTNSSSALMYTDIGNGYERAGAITYSETAELDQNISQINTTFIVKNAGEIDMVSLGTQITINQEIMVYQSYDDETGLLTVKRGALDTIPQNHVAGSVLYFADEFITVDPTEYVTGEIINVKTLTTTPSGILSLDDVDAQQVEIQARAIRPYPPANVQFNGELFPARVIGDLQIVWCARNRVQQTGGQILGWNDGATSIEPGMSFNIELWQGTLLKYSQDYYSGTLLNFNKDELAGQRYTLKIQSWRDGFKSMQVFEHEFLHRMTDERISKPYDLNAVGSESAIQLSWKADNYTSNIDYYNIYRHIQPFDGSDVAYLLLQSNVIEKSFTDETAVAGTRYYYRIEAIVEQTSEEIGLVVISDEIVDAVRTIPLSAPRNITVTVSDI